ncbi:H/ACA ribonucleoprotein complex non-core subunit NAF1, partial [Phytophthora palmivora]
MERNEPVSDLDVTVQYADVELHSVTAQFASSTTVSEVSKAPMVAVVTDDNDDSDSDSSDDEAPTEKKEEDKAKKEKENESSGDESDGEDRAKLRAEIEAAIE